MTQADLAAFARHGGRIDDARAHYPDAPVPWIDLSTGINPSAWAPAAPLRHDPGPLPSPAALDRLERIAAAYFGVAADRVAAVPGSEIALRLLPALGLPRPILAHPPCYGTHRAVADEAVPTGIAPADGTILLANPNNPDGRIVDAATLLALGRAQQARRGWLVVDEAFADAAPGASLLPRLAQDDPVIVLRSFGKFFGLAGLRLGFVVAPAAIVARIRGLVGDWPVSAEAIAWGAAAYADAAWIAATRADLVRRAGRLDAMLAAHGLIVQGASPLFRLVVDDAAAAIFETLARAGILTRPFADRPDWLRFGLPADDHAATRLDRALAQRTRS